jgi:sec-independent protein translocase protein TatC
MTLFEHLGELRTRLIRVVFWVLGLGCVGLYFARQIFGLLMRPVLLALPEASRSLIYTSGIEEINVLMKVGLYAGVFLATPVLLWQIWGFVAPGLHPHERRYATPFVAFGSIAFVTGILFGYYVILPTMFQFLLRDADTAAIEERVDRARTAEREALRYLHLGEASLAADLAKEASRRLSEGGEGQVLARDEAPAGRRSELDARLAALGELMDAARDGRGPGSVPVLRDVMRLRLEALDARERGDLVQASTLADQAIGVLAGVEGLGEGLPALWTFERHLSLAKGQLLAKSWTRPLLTMNEQLTLVLTLELAMGVIFELPLVMALLASLGLVKASFLMKYQRHAFVVCLIIAAVVTPTGDAVNLSLMTGPLVLCYELGVLAAWLVEKRRAARAPTAALPSA